MTDNIFTILLLSDAHIGSPANKLDSGTVFRPLFKDIEEQYASDKRLPSLIVLSGDLAYSGKKEEYAEARKFLEKIFACFDKSYGQIPILIVPGNHDVDRTVIDDAQKEFRKSLDESKVIEMMHDGNITWKRIIERQANWLDFVKGIPDQPWEWDETTMLCTGVLPFSGKDIGIAGLNSSWASHEEKEQGFLWIGQHQYDTAFDRARQAEIRIAVAHHPTDWLHPEEKATMRQRIEANFQIFCHGHEHTHWFNDSRGHLKCEVGACYEGTKGKNVYSWLYLNFAQNRASIRLREYTNQGAGGWRANCIPDKTDSNGASQLSFLITRGTGGNEDELQAIVREKEPTPACWSFPSNIWDFLKILEERFSFRWERGTLTQEMRAPLIYWPVRLRRPAPIHAAQCFVAAGLQKLDCQISLWIDDLGRREYSTEQFVDALKIWFIKVGGDASTLTVNRFSDILDSPEKGQYTDHAWNMLQKWLGTMAYYTDAILRISKIWPATEDPKKIVDEIKRSKPRRLMTPSMVWTCMSVLHEREIATPIMTLGGFDEQGLWGAWRTCCDTPSLRVGHIYVSKLTERSKSREGDQAIHLADKPLDWQSPEDIETEFQLALSEDDSHRTWSNAQSMIPWSINNCVLLPNFVSGSQNPVTIGNKSVRSLLDLEDETPSRVLDSVVAAVSKWLF